MNNHLIKVGFVLSQAKIYRSVDKTGGGKGNRGMKTQKLPTDIHFQIQEMVTEEEKC